VTTPERAPRVLTAEDVLAGSVSATDLPYRYVMLTTTIATRMAIGTAANIRMLDTMFSAIEVLESQGWLLVRLNENMLFAVLRRDVPWAKSAQLVP
jgi:hypothetical protein